MKIFVYPPSLFFFDRLYFMSLVLPCFSISPVFSSSVMTRSVFDRDQLSRARISIGAASPASRSKLSARTDGGGLDT